MKTYNLKPFSEQVLSTQLDKIHPENKNYGCMWAEWENTNYGKFDPKTGNKYIYATPEEEKAYKVILKKEEQAQQEIRAHKYDHVKTPFIDYNNPERWRNGLNEALKEPFKAVEMCEDAYDHFMNCLPPKYFNGSLYMNSEPHHHTNKGEEVCIAGIARKGKYFAQYGTLAELKQNKMFQFI
jgi:hypothetical protein